MARTRTQLRQLVAQMLGFNLVTGTADAGGSTTTLVDSPLQVYPDDAIIGYHIFLTSGTPTFTELIVTDSAQSTGTATFTPTLGAAPDALTYELLPFSATEIHRALDEAMIELYGRGLLGRRHRILFVSGSPIYNADWTYWTSATAIDGWTATTSTLARIRATTASARPHEADTYAQLSVASGSLALNTRWRRYVDDFVNEATSVRFCCPARSAAASAARVNLQITDSAGTTANNRSTTHSGNGDWELLHTASLALLQTDAEIIPTLEAATTDTVEFGLPFIYGGLIVKRYPLPVLTMPNGPSSLRLARLDINFDQLASGRGRIATIHQGSEKPLRNWTFHRYDDEALDNPTGLLIVPSVPSGYLLIAEGEGPLTLPAANTDLVEVTQPESQVLAIMAARILLEKAMGTGGPGARQHYAEKAVLLDRRLAAISATFETDTGAAPLRMVW